MAIFFLFSACKDSNVKPKEKDDRNFATQILYNAKIINHDSGRVTSRFNAPLIEKYELLDSPYVESRKGIYIEFFDKKTPKTPGKLWANYAKMNEKKELYVAKGDVKIINPDGRTFKMKSLYWDKKNRKMYTSDTVFISDKEGNILIGNNGMIAKDDFSQYTLYSGHGFGNAKSIPETNK